VLSGFASVFTEAFFVAGFFTGGVSSELVFLATGALGVVFLATGGFDGLSVTEATFEGIVFGVADLGTGFFEVDVFASIFPATLASLAPFATSFLVGTVFSTVLLLLEIHFCFRSDWAFSSA
jgi:hypothetical protein